MVRKLLLAATAVVALSAQAQADNTSTTFQAGGVNLSSTNQFTVLGDNTSRTTQLAVFANAQSTTQVSLNPFSTNLSIVTQASFF